MSDISTIGIHWPQRYRIGDRTVVASACDGEPIGKEPITELDGPLSYSEDPNAITCTTCLKTYAIPLRMIAAIEKLATSMREGAPTHE